MNLDLFYVSNFLYLSSDDDDKDKSSNRKLDAISIFLTIIWFPGRLTAAIENAAGKDKMVNMAECNPLRSFVG